jgi:hypothetical protein
VTNLNEFLDELNERNVEIVKPTAVDKWGLRIEVDGDKMTYQELEPNWQAAVKETIGWIRKNLNYAEFQADLKPVDLQFKADGTVIITSDKGTIDFQGKKVPSVKYKLSPGVASKIAG